MNSHERAFVESFVCAPRRERFLSALDNPKRRKVFTDELCHPKPNFLRFDQAIRAVPAKQSVPLIAAELRRKGAPEQYYMIGGSLDGRELGLNEALETVVGWDFGVIRPKNKVD